MAKKTIKKPQYSYNKQIYRSKLALSKATGIDRRRLTILIEENPSLTVDEIVKQYKEAQITYEDEEGNQYSSIKEAAKAVGLNPSTLSKYLKLAGNNDLKKAMNLYREEHTYAIIDGVRYATQEELAKSLDVTVVTLTKYIESEGSKEAAVVAIKKLKSYIWRGEKYNSLSSLSKAMEIPRKTLKRILEKEANDDPEEAYKIYQKRNKGKYVSKEKDMKFDSIKSVASYLGKNEKTIGEYLKKYNRDVDKVAFMLKIRDLRKQKIEHKNSQMPTQDMAIILGIKEKELIAYLNSGMTIDQIKEFTNTISKNTQLARNRARSSTIMYDNNESLAQFCIENRINNKTIYHAMTTYGKSKEEALKHYSKYGQKIPTSWIYQKYNVLLRHLLLNEGIDSDKIVAEMRNKVISFKEAIENYMIKEEAKKLEIDPDWQIELYSILTAEHIPEEEKEAFKEAFYVTETEQQGIDRAQDRISKIERKLLLYEMAECIKGNVYPENEMIGLMKVYEITEEEIDTIFLDLYANFEQGIRIAEGQELAQKRRVLNNYIRNWDNVDEQQKREWKENNSEDWEWMESVSSQIAFYKNGIKLKKLTGQDIGMAGYTANVEQCMMANEALAKDLENKKEGNLKNYD